MRPKALVFLSSVLATLLAGMALAQTPAPTIVRWQSGARCVAWHNRGENVQARPWPLVSGEAAVRGRLAPGRTVRLCPLAEHLI